MSVLVLLCRVLVHVCVGIHGFLCPVLFTTVVPCLCVCTCVSLPGPTPWLPEEGIGEVLEKEDCMQALSGQIFMGMVSSQYQARLDIVRLIDGLVNACIRFVYFSLEDELKSKVQGRLSLSGEGPPQPFLLPSMSVHRPFLSPSLCLPQVFAEKMGLETGWNCHISLTPNGDLPGSEIPPSSPSHAGSLHDDVNQGEGRGWVYVCAVTSSH